MEFGGVVAPKDFDLTGRMEVAMERFPVLRRKASHKASTLSGGEQKMLEIARGLLHTPKILFLDEPTLGLDPQTRNQLWSRPRRFSTALVVRAASRISSSSSAGARFASSRSISGVLPPTP